MWFFLDFGLGDYVEQAVLAALGVGAVGRPAERVSPRRAGVRVRAEDGRAHGAVGGLAVRHLQVRLVDGAGATQPRTPVLGHLVAHGQKVARETTTALEGAAGSVVPVNSNFSKIV